MYSINTGYKISRLCIKWRAYCYIPNTIRLKILYISERKFKLKKNPANEEIKPEPFGPQPYAQPPFFFSLVFIIYSFSSLLFQFDRTNNKSLNWWWYSTKHKQMFHLKVICFETIKQITWVNLNLKLKKTYIDFTTWFVQAIVIFTFYFFF